MSQVRRLDQIPDVSTVSDADQIAIWQDGRTRIGRIGDILGSFKGLSAYDVAVKNGFVGPEADWLLSLRGASLAAPTIAAARLLPPADAILVLGYAKAGDGGEALYRRVIAEPAHAGKFQAVLGPWYELSERTVTPEMFGAFGSDVSGPDVDYWRQLQNMANYAMFYGCEIMGCGQGGNVIHCTSKTIDFRPQRLPSSPGYPVNDPYNQTDISFIPSAHMSNFTTCKLMGKGNFKIKAIGQMDRVLWFHNGELPGMIEPYWVVINGVQVDGNNLAEEGIRLTYSYRNDLSHFGIKGVNQGLVLDHVGVSDVSKFLIYAKEVCINAEYGGDDQIHDGEVWPVRYGVTLGGGANTKIYANTFTCQKYNYINPQGNKVFSIGVLMFATPATADFGSRDIKVWGNEFHNFDWAGYMEDNTTAPQKDCYSIVWSNNHVIRSYEKLQAAMLYLKGARGATISGNLTGDRDWEAPRQSGFDYVYDTCENISHVGGCASNTTTTSILVNNSRAVTIADMTFNGVCCSYDDGVPARKVDVPADGPGYIEIINSFQVSVHDCPVNIKDRNGNDRIGSQHIVIERGTSDNNRLVGCPHPLSWIAPYVAAGANTVFGDLQPQRKPRTIATLPSAFLVAAGTEMLVTDGAGGLSKVFAHPSGAWKYVATEANV